MDRNDLIIIENVEPHKGYIAFVTKHREPDLDTYLIQYRPIIDKYPCLRDAIIKHELLHVELAKYLDKDFMVASTKIANIRDNLTRIYEELSEKWIYYEANIKDEELKRLVSELWGQILSYITSGNDEEVLAHLLSISYFIYCYYGEIKYYKEIMDIINELRRKKYDGVERIKEYNIKHSEEDIIGLPSGDSKTKENKEDWDIFNEF